MITPIWAEFAQFCMKAPEFIHPWVTILSKLVRALANPFYKDNWVDIAGYATLVVQELNKREGIK